MIKLGEKVKDGITGFEGVATARAEYLYGCVRVLVESKKLKDGKPIDEWFDEQRLTVKSKADTGGPSPTPPSRDPR